MTKTKNKNMIYNTHRKLQIKQHTTQKTTDKTTQNPLKTRGELKYSAKVNSYCFTSGNCYVSLFTNLVISHEWRKDQEVLRQLEHIHGHLWHIYSVTINQVRVNVTLFNATFNNISRPEYSWKIACWTLNTNQSIKC